MHIFLFYGEISVYGNLYEAMVFLFLALGIGVIGNIAGIGGGVLLMLVFFFAFKINPVIAGGLSLLTIIASTVAAGTFNLFSSIAIFCIGLFSFSSARLELAVLMSLLGA